MNLGEKPGLWFVIATLLPLASFFLILIAFAIRTALRSSREGTLGASLFQALGGDSPKRWPAYVATGAIGLAFVCCLIGFVQFSGDASTIHHAEEELRELQRKYKEDDAARAKLEGAAKEAARNKLKEQRKQIEATELEIHGLESRWQGRFDWLRLNEE